METVAPSAQPAAPSTPTQTPSEGESQSQQMPQGKNASQQQTSSELYEVKVNGKVVKMTRDEVISHASMSHAAQSKFEEAAKTRKQVEKIISTAKSNPIQALMDPSLGLTKDQIRDAFEKWYTAEYIEPETLSPDQRKMKELEQKLRKYEQDEQEKLLRSQQEQEEQLTNKQREYLQNQIIEAMDKSGLPKTKFLAGRMAFYMRENLKNGWEAPIEMIVSQVKKERQAMMSDLVSHSEGESLIQMLGDEVVNKIRQHDLKQLRSKRQGIPTSMGYGNSQPNRDEKISSTEVARRLREMRSGRR